MNEMKYKYSIASILVCLQAKMILIASKSDSKSAFESPVLQEVKKQNCRLWLGFGGNGINYTDKLRPRKNNNILLFKNILNIIFWQTTNPNQKLLFS